MKRKEIILLPMIFQFHKGTIRTIYKKGGYLWVSDFNSIKVRLELTELSLTHSLRVFQFHKGTIRT